MANYDPSEGRGGRPDLFLINLPPDIKVTRTYFTKSEPELKHVPDIFRHDMPKMGKVDFKLYMDVPKILSSDFTLDCSKPAMSAGRSSFYWNEPAYVNRAKNRMLNISKPMLIYDVKNVTLVKNVPDIANRPGTLTVDTQAPMLLAKKGSTTLHFNLPLMVDKTETLLTQSLPELVTKTATVLEKNEPQILCRTVATTVIQTVPELRNSPGTLEQNEPEITENFDQCELEKNEPDFRLGVSVLLQSVPLLKLVKQFLVWNLPLLKSGTSTLKHRVPLLKCVESSLEHNLPERSAEIQEELEHNVVGFSEDRVHEYYWNQPETKPVEEIYMINTPELVVN